VNTSSQHPLATIQTYKRLWLVPIGLAFIARLFGYYAPPLSYVVLGLMGIFSLILFGVAFTEGQRLADHLNTYYRNLTIPQQSRYRVGVTVLDSWRLLDIANRAHNTNDSLLKCLTDNYKDASVLLPLVVVCYFITWGVLTIWH
jgi:hypothetical protein